MVQEAQCLGKLRFYFEYCLINSLPASLHKIPLVFAANFFLHLSELYAELEPKFSYNCIVRLRRAASGAA